MKANSLLVQAPILDLYLYVLTDDHFNMNIYEKYTLIFKIQMELELFSFLI